MKTYVYALHDPRTREVRYVGVTVKPKERYWTHCSCIKAQSSPARQRWVKALKRNKLRPEMVIVESFNVPNAQNAHTDRARARERYWIQHYKRLGNRLLNRNEVRCAYCKSMFDAVRPWQEFCSEKCGNRSRYERLCQQKDAVRKVTRGR